MIFGSAIVARLGNGKKGTDIYASRPHLVNTKTKYSQYTGPDSDSLHTIMLIPPRQKWPSGDEGYRRYNIIEVIYLADQKAIPWKITIYENEKVIKELLEIMR